MSQRICPVLWCDQRDKLKRNKLFGRPLLHGPIWSIELAAVGDPHFALSSLRAQLPITNFCYYRLTEKSRRLLLVAHCPEYTNSRTLSLTREKEVHLHEKESRPLH